MPKKNRDQFSESAETNKAPASKRPRAKRQKTKSPELEPPKPEPQLMERRSPMSVLGLNLIAIVVLGIVFVSVNIPIVTNMVTGIAPCAAPTPRAIAAAIIFMLIVHALWQLFSSSIKDVLKQLGKDERKELGLRFLLISLLVKLLDQLSPPIQSTRLRYGLYGIAVVLGLTTWLMGLSEFSPFPNP